MLPLAHQIAFFVFALLAGGIGVYGFYRLYLRIKRGAASTEIRWNELPRRITQALTSSLSQERTFRDRPWISLLHSFIFYGFVFYLLVNVIDGLEGYIHFSISSRSLWGALYNFWADLLSFLVLVGVISLVIRRLYHPSKRDFYFRDNTPIHEKVKQGYILRDSLIVSGFITFHVGSRILGNAAKMVEEARLHGGSYDWVQMGSSFLGQLFFSGLSEQAIHGWRIFGFWGALGSILAFLAYFPYTKHIHIFMAPLNYALKRPVGSGVLPPMKGLEQAMEAEEPKLGAEKLEDLEWPRLLDAYACIQCNRCQDVCPAHVTGKALSPAALEINKRMELNMLASSHTPFVLRPTAFEEGASSARPLLEFAINEESIWGCTTCGACMQVCPVQNEQMLDIVDIRRQQVMVAGEFPVQLQTAFRGMERASNPWGISRDKRMEWAEGLRVPTIDENPTPDVIYWVGCAASYDPGAQKVARSFVQLLDKAGVNYAVLGKKEACTGDSARRAGNEFLYQQLAQENVETLNSVQPKLIVATCPHCMNAIGHEYKQLGGDYQTMHHTEYLEMLVQAGKLPLEAQPQHVAYHDPCYLGRHNGVYEAPRQLLTKMAGEILQLERERENSFCCGAGGAQFWKEEEEGTDRVADNRFREIQARLDAAAERSREYAQNGEQASKVVAVGCPFCKAMINSAPSKQERDDIVVKDVAELMWEAVGGTPPQAPAVAAQQASMGAPAPALSATEVPVMSSTNTAPKVDLSFDEPRQDAIPAAPATTSAPQPESSRKAWKPKAQATSTEATPQESSPEANTGRKAWKPKASTSSEGSAQTDAPSAAPVPAPIAPAHAEAPEVSGQAQSTGRKTWKPKAAAQAEEATSEPSASQPAVSSEESTGRKVCKPKAQAAEAHASEDVASVVPAASVSSTASTDTGRKVWKPKAKSADDGAQDTAKAQAQVEQQSDSSSEKSPVSSAEATATATSTPETGRKKWTPKKQS